MLWAQDASMADEQVHLQGQLFHELKKRFPEVPDSVVSSLMQQNGFIRERCIDALGRESKNYLENGLNLPLSHLHIGGSPPGASVSGSPGQVLCARSNSNENSAHLPASSTSTPSSSKPSDLTAQQHNDMQFTTTKNFFLGPTGGKGAGDAQNGPYLGFESSGTGQMAGASPGVWLGYPPMHLPQTGHQSQNFQHGAVSRGGGTHSPYPPQALQSGPSSIPPMSQPHYMTRWSYDPNHRTPPQHRGPPQSFTQRFPPPQQGGRTPSPQHPYSMYPYDYNQTFHYRASSPGSPGGAGSQASGGGYLPPGSQSFTPGMGHAPATTTTTSPSSSVSNLWYIAPGQQQGHQSSGSNSSTPTRSPFPVFSPSPWQQGYHPIDSEHLHHSAHPNAGPVAIVGPHNGPLEGRRGSEDTGYTQALLLHQQSRMEKLMHDLDHSLNVLEVLRQENLEMERESAERRNQRSSTFPTADDVGKMREENRRLLIDIQLMTREIDMYNNGQALLGVVDPQEQQSFYKNIGSTGQRGSIHAGGDDGTERLPIEEEGPPARVPPARPPPPTVLPVSGCGRSEAPVTQLDPGRNGDEGDQWNCSACTFLNHPALDRCECCEMPRLNPCISSEYS